MTARVLRRRCSDIRRAIGRLGLGAALGAREDFALRLVAGRETSELVRRFVVSSNVRLGDLLARRLVLADRLLAALAVQTIQVVAHLAAELGQCRVRSDQVLL